MGFHVSWLATSGKAPDAIRAELGLAETNRRENMPESDMSELIPGSGWHIVFFNDPMPAELRSATLSRLSQNAVVMAFSVEETSMISMAAGHAGGIRRWQVLHDATLGLDHLEVHGDPPAPFEEIRNSLLARLSQSTQHVDYLFDLPAMLSKSITGFRHDEEFDGAAGEAFSVLERS
jgi:hypothetical protein